MVRRDKGAVRMSGDFVQGDPIAPFTAFYGAYEGLYLFEHELFQRVRLGSLPVNCTGMAVINNEWFKRSVGEDYQSYGRNQFITYCGVACKSAIDGGAQVEDAFMIWKYYQRELGRMRDYADVDALADRMLNDFSELNATNPEVTYPDRLEDALRLIHRNVNRPLRVSQVVEELGCSRSQLDRDFAHYLGCSPSEYIVQEKLKKAKRYLHFTAFGVADIGASLGFADPAHFSAVFKRHEGVSPREYREASAS